ncbi:MAG: nucleotidyl transferase AbiEii/AbiGii toxin family protein [bacterium]|nr:nucleotidyl transferase AbiEii/AbiGii toxin family protein [bacterium]
MNNQILAILKEKFAGLAVHGALEVETQRNALKEELQFYVLNFIYHHPEYSSWVMYGGSALRICHGLDRMSVDLDFEVDHAVSKHFLNELKNEVESYFKNTFNTDSDILVVKITTNRGLRLCFNVGDELGINHPSKQVIVKIDLNHFAAPKTVIERRPINRDQLSFVIKTYNMSSLMASKIAAILLRGQRGGLGGIMYAEKGRDVYDLLWYMTKKVVPDLDYLIAKKIDVKDLRILFDKLTLQMNKVNDTNLKQDLSPLFTNQTFIENWLKNWRTTYLRLFEDYDLRTATTLERIVIAKDPRADNYFFNFSYNTDNNKMLTISYSISDYWLTFRDGDLSMTIDEKLKSVVEFMSATIDKKNVLQDKLLQYATLFYRKTEYYLKKMNNTVFGDHIDTKLIRMTADNINQKEQIVLNKSTLLSCELDDLLK